MGKRHVCQRILVCSIALRCCQYGQASYCQLQPAIPWNCRKPCRLRLAGTHPPPSHPSSLCSSQHLLGSSQEVPKSLQAVCRKVGWVRDQDQDTLTSLQQWANAELAAIAPVDWRALAQAFPAIDACLPAEAVVSPSGDAPAASQPASTQDESTAPRDPSPSVVRVLQQARSEGVDEASVWKDLLPPVEKRKSTERGPAFRWSVNDTLLLFGGLELFGKRGLSSMQSISSKVFKDVVPVTSIRTRLRTLRNSGQYAEFERQAKEMHMRALAFALAGGASGPASQEEERRSHARKSGTLGQRRRAGANQRSVLASSDDSDRVPERSAPPVPRRRGSGGSGSSASRVRAAGAGAGKGPALRKPAIASEPPAADSSDEEELATQDMVSRGCTTRVLHLGGQPAQVNLSQSPLRADDDDAEADESDSTERGSERSPPASPSAAKPARGLAAGSKRSRTHREAAVSFARRSSAARAARGRDSLADTQTAM